MKIMNPLGEGTLKSPWQIRLENTPPLLALIAMIIWIAVAMYLGTGLAKNHALSTFWYLVETSTSLIIIAFIIGMNPRLNNRWPYRVDKDNSNIYFLNDDQRVTLAKPGLYCGVQKSRLFKIELEMKRQAEFNLPGSCRCRVRYLLRFYHYPSPYQVDLFLTWLQELASLRKAGQNAVFNKLRQGATDNKYPFSIEVDYDDLELV